MNDIWLSFIDVISACSFTYSSELSEYFSVDLAGGFGFSASSQGYVENNSPRQAFVSQNRLGWQPRRQRVGEWLAIHMLTVLCKLDFIMTSCLPPNRNQE